VEEVTGLIMLLVFGGMDNSSLASTWTEARLLSTPRALAAVVEEQKQILRDYGDHVDYNAFLKMNTLHWSGVSRRHHGCTLHQRCFFGRYTRTSLYKLRVATSTRSRGGIQ
jgi:hypothetical protein